jgi:hypothetical protein
MTDTDRSSEPQLDIAGLAATVRAPQSLHRSVRAMVDAAGEERAPRRHPRARLRLVGAGALGGAAAGAAALTLALSGGSGALTVQRAVALTLSRATMPAPRASAHRHAQLQASVEGVAFPYWEERFGWRSAGARVDRLAGRTVTTVFYADRGGHWIGYAIASGRAPRVGSGALSWYAGVPYRVLRQDGATVVAWPRAGHLCVIAGRGLDAATLLRLARWSEA